MQFEHTLETFAEFRKAKKRGVVIGVILEVLLFRLSKFCKSFENVFKLHIFAVSLNSPFNLKML